MAKWQKGDLGRFLSESPKRPRFEVVGGTATKIEVWYGGSRSTDQIPYQTFIRDCTNLWELQGPVPVLADWVKEGGEFEFSQGTPQIRQAEIKDARGILTHTSMVDLASQRIQIRRIRWDYTSCIFRDVLVLIPLPTVVKYGAPLVSRWQHILNDEEEEERQEQLDRIFKDL